MFIRHSFCCKCPAYLFWEQGPVAVNRCGCVSVCYGEIHPVQFWAVCILLAVHPLRTHFLFTVFMCNILVSSCFWQQCVGLQPRATNRRVTGLSVFCIFWGAVEVAKSNTLTWRNHCLWERPIRWLFMVLVRSLCSGSKICLSFTNFVCFKYLYKCFFSIVEHRVKLSHSWCSIKCLNPMSSSGLFTFGRVNISCRKWRLMENLESSKGLVFA